jgi:hypothetical protein
MSVLLIPRYLPTVPAGTRGTLSLVGAILREVADCRDISIPSLITGDFNAGYITFIAATTLNVACRSGLSTVAGLVSLNARYF